MPPIRTATASIRGKPERTIYERSEESQLPPAENPWNANQRRDLRGHDLKTPHQCRRHLDHIFEHSPRSQVLTQFLCVRLAGGIGHFDFAWLAPPVHRCEPTLSNPLVSEPPDESGLIHRAFIEFSAMHSNSVSPHGVRSCPDRDDPTAPRTLHHAGRSAPDPLSDCCRAGPHCFRG